jgi:hypothetical protein
MKKMFILKKSFAKHEKKNTHRMVTKHEYDQKMIFFPKSHTPLVEGNK